MTTRANLYDILDVHIYVTQSYRHDHSRTNLVNEKSLPPSAASSPAMSQYPSTEDITEKRPDSLHNAIAAQLGHSSSSRWQLFVTSGRPPTQLHVDALEGDKMVVTACGPPSLCDTVREAVKERTLHDEILREGDAELKYIEEAFTW